MKPAQQAGGGPSGSDRAARRVVVSGASGLIGSRVRSLLTELGRRVDTLVRREPEPGRGEIWWDPASRQIDASALEGAHAVVHLAGENVGRGRWTTDRKAAIRASRVGGTGLLAQALAGLRCPPKVLVAASAMGYYGDRGDEALTEASAPGAGFLADVCQEWEAATQPAARAGIRVVNLRTGVVLSPAGGALLRMLGPFRWGLGGRIGSGRQFISWITLTDMARVIAHAIATEGLAGPVNATAPEPVTNLEFTKALGRILRRPALVPVPGFAIRLLLGEMGRELLLSSARVFPEKLVASGFVFRCPRLEDALRLELGLPA